jgi:hypothetical protein
MPPGRWPMSRRPAHPYRASEGGDEGKAGEGDGIMLVADVGRLGSPEVLTAREVHDPGAGPGRVVVRTSAADVLSADAMTRSGPGVH